MKIFPALLFLFYSMQAPGQSALDTGTHYVRINGFKANYYVRGKGPVCICPTPGWGPDYWVYTSGFKPLEAYFTMVYFDTRGTGLSEAPEDSNYYRYYFARDLDALRRRLDQEKVWLIGHSAAGTQVIRYACLYNKHLNGVIAVAPYWGNETTPDPPDTVYINAFLNNLDKRKKYPFYDLGRGIFTGSAKVDFGTSLRAVFPFYFHDTSNIAVYRASIPPQSSVDDRPGKHDGKVIPPYSAYNSNADYQNARKVSVPVLLIAGDDDCVSDPVVCASRIHALIKSSDLCVIKNAGHFAWIEQPEAFWKGIKDFFERNQVRPNSDK